MALNGQGVSAPALNSQEFLAGTTDEQIARHHRAAAFPAPRCPRGGTNTEEPSPTNRSRRSWRTSARGRRRRRAVPTGARRPGPPVGRHEAAGLAVAVAIGGLLLAACSGGGLGASARPSRSSRTTRQAAGPHRRPQWGFERSRLNTVHGRLGRDLRHPRCSSTCPSLLPRGPGHLHRHERLRPRSTSSWCSRPTRMAADFPIVGFEGEPNRIDEDAKGVRTSGRPAT